MSKPRRDQRHRRKQELRAPSQSARKAKPVRGGSAHRAQLARAILADVKRALAECCARGEERVLRKVARLQNGRRPVVTLENRTLLMAHRSAVERGRYEPGYWASMIQTPDAVLASRVRNRLLAVARTFDLDRHAIRKQSAGDREYLIAVQNAAEQLFSDDYPATRDRSDSARYGTIHLLDLALQLYSKDSEPNRRWARTRSALHEAHSHYERARKGDSAARAQTVLALLKIRAIE